jgi:inward rectifier potassium channel
MGICDNGEIAYTGLNTRRKTHTMPLKTSSKHSDVINDLGFGSRVMRDSALRLLNRDGTFNVSRSGLPLFKSLNLYQTLLSLPWWQFNLFFVGLYLSINLLFASLYFLCGPMALIGTEGMSGSERLLESFFFSVHTLTTVGFGHITPKGVSANFLVVLEAFLGLSGFAVAAALMFARFARPTAKILFSDQAVIGPYHGGTCFEFRIANGSPNELIEVEVRILLCMTDSHEGVRIRHFHQLSLERDKAAFFPLDWTVAHPITTDSPLHAMTPQKLRQQDAEFLILINAIDDKSSHTVHARSSFKWDEIVWGARFKNMYRRTRNGRMSIDLKRIHDIQNLGTSVSSDQTVWDF